MELVLSKANAPPKVALEFAIFNMLASKLAELRYIAPPASLEDLDLINVEFLILILEFDSPAIAPP